MRLAARPRGAPVVSPRRCRAHHAAPAAQQANRAAADAPAPVSLPFAELLPAPLALRLTAIVEAASALTPQKAMELLSAAAIDPEGALGTVVRLEAELRTDLAAAQQPWQGDAQAPTPAAAGADPTRARWAQAGGAAGADEAAAEQPTRTVADALADLDAAVSAAREELRQLRTARAQHAAGEELDKPPSRL